MREAKAPLRLAGALHRRLASWMLPAVFAAIILMGCQSSDRNVVVLYTSQDQFFAEPILKEFTRETGIEVRAVFDTESVKTAGLANRIRQEAANPRCDVFWSNEEMHTRLMIAEGMIDSNAVRFVGYRTRRLVVNTNLLALARAPTDLLTLTNAFWKGKVALAYPLYGTTGSHFLALRQQWGETLWKRWCEGMAANGTRIVDGNSVVVKLVGAGEVWIGLTDSDDVTGGKRSGWPVEQAPLNEQMLAISNAISRVSKTGNPGADRLVEFLARADTIERLVANGALEGRDLGPLRDSTAKISWPTISADMAEATKTLKGVFLRS